MLADHYVVHTSVYDLEQRVKPLTNSSARFLPQFFVFVITPWWRPIRSKVTVTKVSFKDIKHKHKKAFATLSEKSHICIVYIYCIISHLSLEWHEGDHLNSCLQQLWRFWREERRKPPSELPILPSRETPTQYCPPGHHGPVYTQTKQTTNSKFLS